MDKDKTSAEPDLRNYSEEAVYEYEFAMTCHEGHKFPKTNQTAFQWFIYSACKGNVEAQKMLIQYYSEGIISEPNIREAYIWALIARVFDCNSIEDSQITIFEKQLTKKEKLSAQKETADRHLQFLTNGIISLSEVYNPLEEGRPDPVSEMSNPVNAKADGGKLASLQGWALSKFEDLRVEWYVCDRNISFKYKRKSLTVYDRSAFSANFLSLLKMYYNSELIPPTEPKVQYRGYSVAGETRSRRENFRVVADFNHKMRAIFALDKDFKAFDWVGKGTGKTLKANFKLKVIY